MIFLTQFCWHWDQYSKKFGNSLFSAGNLQTEESRSAVLWILNICCASVFLFCVPFLSHPQPLLFGLSPEFRVCPGHFYDLRVARLGVGGIRAQLREIRTVQEEAKQTDKQIRGELDGKNGRKQGFSAGSPCSSWDKRRLSDQTATTVGTTRQVWGLMTEVLLMLLWSYTSYNKLFWSLVLRCLCFHIWCNPIFEGSWEGLLLWQMQFMSMQAMS